MTPEPSDPGLLECLWKTMGPMLDDLKRNIIVLDQKMEGLAELKDQGHKNILEELRLIKEQTVKTNGRVSDLEKWRIQRDQETQTRSEISRRADKNYIGPIVTGLVVGIILLLAQLYLKRM